MPADVDDSGGVQINDPIALLDFLFDGIGQVPAPYPDPGVDPTEDSLVCE